LIISYADGGLFKKGLGLAFHAARVATKYADDFRDALIEIAQQYKNLAEQRKEGDGHCGSIEHHQRLEALRQQVLGVRNRARDVRKLVPKRRSSRPGYHAIVRSGKAYSFSN